MGEAWYEAAEAAPVSTPAEAIFAALATLAEARPGEVGFGSPAAVLVPTPWFNRICDEGGSKAVVLSRGLIRLIPSCLARLPQDDQPVLIQCDKHGGRNYYAGMIQEAFPDCWVVAERESAEESRYRVEMFERPVTVTFRLNVVQVPPRSLHAAVQPLLDRTRPRAQTHRRLPRRRPPLLRRNPPRDGKARDRRGVRVA